MTLIDLEILTNESPFPILLEWDQKRMCMNVLGFREFEEETRNYIDSFRPAGILADYRFIDSGMGKLTKKYLLGYKGDI